MGFRCGIVGLPNAGKSTLFNALARATVAAESYPYCTIEPNVGVVPVPDPRLEDLAAIVRPARVVPASLTFVDVAGLVAGASRGEGLGNRFLGHIREVDAIAHVVRCFEAPEVTHVAGRMDPAADIETIDTELMLADIETVERALGRAEKSAKAGGARSEAARGHHRAHRPAPRRRTARPDPRPRRERARRAARALPPHREAGDVRGERGRGGRSRREPPVSPRSGPRRAPRTPGSCRCAPPSKRSSPPSTRASGTSSSRTSVSRSRDSIGSCGPATGCSACGRSSPRTPRRRGPGRCARGPPRRRGAGRIHTDFERGFIRAEVVTCDDFVALGGEQGARDAGRWRLEGRDYVIAEGDVIRFRFNV